MQAVVGERSPDGPEAFADALWSMATVKDDLIIQHCQARVPSPERTVA